VSLATITSTPLPHLWKQWLWTKVDMNHLAHNPTGFELIHYCEEHFKTNDWDFFGCAFYFRNKHEATIFALRWL